MTAAARARSIIVMLGTLALLSACGVNSRVDDGRVVRPGHTGSTGLSFRPGGPPDLRLARGLVTLGVTFRRSDRSLVLTVPAQSLGFDLDSATPTDIHRADRAVDAIVPAIAGGQRVSVSAFASSEGDPQHNLALSQRRANWVCGALRHRGVTATVECTGRGAIDRPPTGPGPEDRIVQIAVTGA